MNFYSKNKNRFTTILLLVILFIVSYSIKCNAYNFHEEELKRVLLISSYGPNFETFFQQLDGIQSQFKGENIQLDVEYMDSKRFYTDENLNNFYTSLKYKMENSNTYDAIIVTDDNAFDFMQEYQEVLFKKIPIVFLGVNNVGKAIQASENPYITGVIESISIEETIEIASKFNNHATNVVALTDNTNSGQGDLESYYLEQNNFEKLSFSDLDLSQLDFQEFANKLQELDDNDIVLMLSVFSDKNNDVISFHEGLQLVLDNCSQPIYHTYYHGIGDGIIGGKVISHYEQGSRAASIVRDIFSGRNISDIECVKESLNKYMFDYNVIKAYGIDEKLLPKGALLINKDESFLEHYLKYIIGVILILILQFCLIMFLQMNIIKRKKSEQEALMSREKFIEANDELIITNEELTASLE
jgi:ABC-type uncharacterized transport system substrate-binding protein